METPCVGKDQSHHKGPNVSLLQMQEDEVRLLRDVLDEPWQEQHQQAMRAREWEIVLGKCLWLLEALPLCWTISCEGIVSGEIADRTKYAEFLRRVVANTIAAVRLAHNKATAFAKATDQTIDRLDEIGSTLQEVERWQEPFLVHLSLIDDTVIAEAKAEYAAGDYPSAGVALADLLAARHAARLTPSYAQLRNWADRSPPPPSWYEEEMPH
jgi:hypothetical protein